MITWGSLPLKSFQVPKGSEKLWRRVACAGDWLPQTFTAWDPTSSFSPPLQVTELNKPRQVGEGQLSVWVEESADPTASERAAPAATTSIVEKRFKDWSELLAHAEPCQPSQIKAIAAKPEQLSERVGLKNGSHLHWKMSAVQRPTPPRRLQSSGYPIWDVCRYTSSDLKSTVPCWCSGAYWLGWLHCFLSQSVLNLYVSALWVSWTELAAAAMYQKTGKRSKLPQLLQLASSKMRKEAKPHWRATPWTVLSLRDHLSQSGTTLQIVKEMLILQLLLGMQELINKLVGSELSHRWQVELKSIRRHLESSETTKILS